MIRSLLTLTALALVTILPATASAQDERIGTLGRTFLRQGIAVDKCSGTNQCTVRMSALITTAGNIATRASKLMNDGDTACMPPSMKFYAAYTKQVQPAIKGWQRTPGTWQAKQRFVNAILKVAATLPALYHKC